MNTVKEIDAFIKKALRERKLMFLWGMDVCKAYMKTHSNCFGCSSEKVCERVVRFKNAILDGENPDETFFDNLEEEKEK
jgi:hypothetical protein